MRKKKQEVKYTSKLPKYLNSDEVQSVLEEVLDLVVSGASDTGVYMLAKRGLYNERLKYWRREYTEIEELYNIITDIDRLKLENRLLNNTANSTGAIFLLKVHHGYIEEDKKRQLENDKEIAEITKDTIINIGWDDAQD